MRAAAHAVLRRPQQVYLLNIARKGPFYQPHVWLSRDHPDALHSRCFAFQCTPHEHNPPVIKAINTLGNTGNTILVLPVGITSIAVATMIATLHRCVGHGSCLPITINRVTGRCDQCQLAHVLLVTFFSLIASTCLVHSISGPALHACVAYINPNQSKGSVRASYRTHNCKALQSTLQSCTVLHCHLTGDPVIHEGTL